MTSINEMFAKANKYPTTVALDAIEVNPQIRTKFDEQSLKELAEHIKDSGIVQPLLLRPLANGRFELVAGERRYRAAKIAGLAQVPVLVRPLTDDEFEDAQFAENIHRENLDLIDEANALKRRLDKLGGDRTLLGKEVKKSQAWISQRLALLDLPPQAQRLMDENITSDATTLNNLATIERKDPVVAKALVDKATAPGGKAGLRKETETVKKNLKDAKKTHQVPGKSTPAASGPKPSMATPRDRSQEEPSAATVTGGAGIFPAPPLKPHERAINALVDAARKPDADPAKIIATSSPSDVEAATKHAAAFFERGKVTSDLQKDMVRGLMRNEFGKNPTELVSLLAFLQGQGSAGELSLQAILTAIATASH